jgi:acetylglutamate kinase
MTEISPLDQARILSEALPHMQQYDEETIVIKYGGHAMGDEETAKNFARDIVLLEQTAINPVVVHGGGPQIATMLKRLGIQSEFAAGLRITDAATIEIVEMVLAGSVNKEIVAAINAEGGRAVGISGKDANLMRARRLERRVRDPNSNVEEIIDFGFVGEPVTVDPHIVEVISRSDLIPVIAPIGAGSAGETLNINADTFAGALASAMKAKRLLLLTDVEGVLDREGKIIKSLTHAEAEELIENGTISGGMIPKIESCLDVIAEGVEAVVIINGKVPHAVLLELFTEHGAGTLIERRRRRGTDR